MILALLLALQAPEPVATDIDASKQVVIVVNENVADSVAIGTYYAKRRKIPESQVCRIKAGAGEICSWPEARKDILEPLKAFLATRPDVLFVVPVYGVPVKTSEENPGNDIKEGDTLSQMVKNRDFCCIDREIELLKVEHEIEGWLPSKVFNATRHLTREDGIYIVSRLDGPTPEAARALVDNALYGEAYGIEGECLIDTRGLGDDPGYGPIDREMKNCAKIYEKFGFTFTHDDKAEVVDLATRTNQAHYWGWYTGDILCSKEDWRFNRGAVGAHLHSFSAAALRSKTSTWTGPLVQHGITGTCGTVYEPLASGFPYGTAFLDRFFQGYSFGEAMVMSSMFTSWMAVFVGDPLYAPYAKGMRERQKRNVETVKKAYPTIAAALDAGDVEAADKAMAEVKAIGIAYAGAEDCSFLELEIRSRRAWPDKKATGTIAQLRKALDQGDAAAALAISPSSFAANLLAARRHVDLQEGRKALACLDVALKVDPGLEVLKLRGRALRLTKQPKEAAAAFQQALTISFDIECAAGLGELLLEEKNYAEAVRLLESARASRPGDREISIELARAHVAMKGWTAAVAVLDPVVNALPRAWADLKPYAETCELLAAALKGEGRDKTRGPLLTTLVRDLRANRVKATPKAQLAAWSEKADELMTAGDGKALDELPAYADATTGLPRLVIQNKSAADLQITVVGPIGSQLSFKASPKSPGKPFEAELVPGVYRVVVVRTEKGKPWVLRREQRFEPGRRYGLGLDGEFKLYKPGE